MCKTLRFGRFQPVHEDARRTILEEQFPGESLSLQRLIIKDRVPLGNHYHEHKREVFVVLRGGGMVRYARVGEDGRPEDVRQRDDLGPGSVIVVPARVAHAFLLEPGSELLCYSEVLFDVHDLNRLVLIPTPD